MRTPITHYTSFKYVMLINKRIRFVINYISKLNEQSKARVLSVPDLIYYIN